MIHPIESTKVSGILWYQGESNESRAYEYNKSFPLLINSWREKFGKTTPFYFVQLATYDTPGNSNDGCNWAELREAQTNALKLENTGMVVTTDIGNPKDIHPRNKKTVGERLTNLALKNNLKSPVFNDFSIEGNKIIITFNTKDVIISKDGKPLTGFEISGTDQKFYPAKAEIKDNKVIVTSSDVPNPVAARYGWKGDDSENNLFTEKGLPISPFRTDNFKTITKDKKFQINLK